MYYTCIHTYAYIYIYTYIFYISIYIQLIESSAGFSNTQRDVIFTYMFFTLIFLSTILVFNNSELWAGGNSGVCEFVTCSSRLICTFYSMSNHSEASGILGVYDVIYIYTYVYIYIYVYMYIHMHICIHIYVQMYLHIYIHIYVCIYTYISIWNTCIPCGIEVHVD